MPKDEILNYWFQLSNHPVEWTSTPTLPVQTAQKVENSTNWQIEQNFEYSGWKEELIWDTDAILNDLRENHVKIEKNAEVEWYKWKKVHIDLPAVWNFEWFKFDYFVSNDFVYKKDFEAKSELKKKSYSMNDVSKLLQAMNEYMTELWGKNDGNIDYETELKYWEFEKYRCTAWDCLKAITWLKYWYWLSDKDVAWIMDSRAVWDCGIVGCCRFNRYNNDNFAKLFLRLSD